MNKVLQKRLIYILMVIGLVWMYVSYVPFLMDYYVCRPEMSFSAFLRYNISNDVYGFEGVLIALMIAFLFCITWKGGTSTVIMSVVLFAMTHGSYVKYVNRKELLKLDDFLLTEAAGMAAGYLRFEFNRYLLVFAGGLIFFCALGVGLERIRRKILFPQNIKEAEKNKKRLILNKEVVFVFVARLLTVSFVGFLMVFHTNRFILAKAMEKRAEDATAVETEADKYVLYHFVKNDRLYQVSAEETAESYEFLLSAEEPKEAEETSVRPNVIVIMNESWWNTDNIDSGKVSFSMDPMGPYKRLSDSCITGHLTSNVYGGGTISSEAEFLTGLNTKYYVTSSTIYEKTMDRKLPSVVDYFNALDYETVAIHPYYGDFYNRDTVYDTMGFDEEIYDEDMVHQEIYTRYISDESLAKEIIAEYEEQGEEDNKFIWSVSVSNHRRSLAYHIDSVENYDYPISVELKDAELEEEDDAILVNYVNGIYYAGLAYEQLINYFAGVDEPVIVVMYGDHIPNFSVETREALGLSDENAAWSPDVFEDSGFFEEFTAQVPADDFSDEAAWEAYEAANQEPFEMLQKMYSVPVIMWSNFELESEPEFGGESIYYLPQMLLESAGLPDSEMSRMLKHQRSVFKANAREYVLNADGEQLLEYTEEELETLNHSKAVIYDILFGEKMEGNVWLPIVAE